MRNILTVGWLLLCAWCIIACVTVSDDKVIKYVQSNGYTNVRVNFSTWKVIEAGCSSKHSSAFQVRATNLRTGLEDSLLVCIEGMNPVELRDAYSY